MNADRAQYWVVVATTVPVLALSIVLEIRWALGRARADQSEELLRGIAALNGGALLLAAASEIIAVTVLMHWRDNDALRLGVSWAFCLLVSLTILNPAIGLMQFASARRAAWVAGIPFRLRIRINLLSRRRVQRKRLKSALEHVRLLERRVDIRDEARAMALASLEALSLIKEADLRPDLVEMRGRLQSRLNEFDARLAFDVTEYRFIESTLSEVLSDADQVRSLRSYADHIEESVRRARKAKYDRLGAMMLGDGPS